MDPNDIDKDVVNGQGWVEEELPPYTLLDALFGDLDNVVVAHIRCFNKGTLFQTLERWIEEFV